MYQPATPWALSAYGAVAQPRAAKRRALHRGRRAPAGASSRGPRGQSTSRRPRKPRCRIVRDARPSLVASRRRAASGRCVSVGEEAGAFDAPMGVEDRIRMWNATCVARRLAAMKVSASLLDISQALYKRSSASALSADGQFVFGRRSANQRQWARQQFKNQSGARSRLYLQPCSSPISASFLVFSARSRADVLTGKSGAWQIRSRFVPAFEARS